MELRTKRQGIKAAKKAIESYHAQYKELDYLQRDITSSKEKLEKELEEAFRFLAEGLLLSFDSHQIQSLSTEIGMLHLPKEKERLEEAHLERIERRLEIEDQEEFIQRDQLMSEPGGTYILERQEAEQEVESATKQLHVYQNDKDFMSLWRRKLKGPRNGITKFFESIFGIKWHYRRKEKRVLKRIHGEVMQQLFFDYTLSKNYLEKAQKELEARKAKISQLQELIAEHESLKIGIESYEENALATLVDKIRQYLSTHSSLKNIHQTIRQEARSMLASIMAKQEKINYFYQMQRDLISEMYDRKDKADSINRVRNIWRRYPNGYLRGDKRNWLIDLPAKKAQSTRKRSNWMRNMHRNIDHFDDYDTYDRLLIHSHPVLLYDLISLLGSERMPYDGFAKKVISEVAKHRNEHQQERPDYSQIKNWIKEDGVKEEELQEEAALLAAANAVETEIPEPVLEDLEEVEVFEEDAFADIS